MDGSETVRTLDHSIFCLYPPTLWKAPMFEKNKELPMDDTNSEKKNPQKNLWVTPILKIKIHWKKFEFSNFLFFSNFFWGFFFGGGRNSNFFCMMRNRRPKEATMEDSEERPFCLICQKYTGYQCMTPSWLEWWFHYKSRHTQLPKWYEIWWGAANILWVFNTSYF